MSHTELLNVIACIVLTPGLTFLGVTVWNAVVMPEQLRQPISLLLWLQAATCSVFLIGMILRIVQLDLFTDWASAFLVGAQAITVVMVIVRMLRLHKYLAAILIVLLVLLLSGAK